MINTGIKEIINYPIIHEVFDNADVLVNIFHVDRNYKGETVIREVQKGKETSRFSKDLHNIEIIPLNKIEDNIVNKIRPFISKENNFGKLHVLPTEPFRITSSGNVGRGNKTYALDMQASRDTEYNVAVAFMELNRSMSYMYTKRYYVPNRGDIIDDYKILCGGRLNKNNTVISNINAISGPSVCSSSYAVLFSSKDRAIASRAYYYIKTKFVRYLVRLLCEDGMTNLSPYRFSLVPEQDYSNNSNISWTNSLASLDAQLYQKYNLSKEEIDYIENIITY